MYWLRMICIAFVSPPGRGITLGIILNSRFLHGRDKTTDSPCTQEGEASYLQPVHDEFTSRPFCCRATWLLHLHVLSLTRCAGKHLGSLLPCKRWRRSLRWWERAGLPDTCSGLCLQRSDTLQFFLNL